MGQHTLQLSEDCRRIGEFLNRCDVSPEVSMGRGTKKLKRRLSSDGHFLFHAQEIYGDPAFDIPEKRVFAALNELVSQGKAKTHHFSGMIWYSL